MIEIEEAARKLIVKEMLAQTAKMLFPARNCNTESGLQSHLNKTPVNL